MKKNLPDDTYVNYFVSIYILWQVSLIEACITPLTTLMNKPVVNVFDGYASLYVLSPIPENGIRTPAKLLRVNFVTDTFKENSSS